MTNTPSQELRPVSTHRVSDGRVSYARTTQGQWVVLLRTGDGEQLVGGTRT